LHTMRVGTPHKQKGSRKAHLVKANVTNGQISANARAVTVRSYIQKPKGAQAKARKVKAKERKTKRATVREKVVVRVIPNTNKETQMQQAAGIGSSRIGIKKAASNHQDGNPLRGDGSLQVGNLPNGKKVDTNLRNGEANLQDGSLPVRGVGGRQAKIPREKEKVKAVRKEKAEVEARHHRERKSVEIGTKEPANMEIVASLRTQLKTADGLWDQGIAIEAKNAGSNIRGSSGQRIPRRRLKRRSKTTRLRRRSVRRLKEKQRRK